MKTLRKVLKVALPVLGIAGVAGWLASQPVPVPEHSSFGPTLAEVRALAVSTREPLPTQLRSLRIGINQAPGFAVVAGGGFEKVPLIPYSYQLVFRDRTAIIDAVNDEETQKALFPDSRFLPEAYARMQQALRQADFIAITHEHFDHCTGISRSPYFDEIAPRVVMTEEQLRSPEMKRSRFTPEQISKLKPLRYERLHLLRPGVVLIKAPGHTPGSQMVYVRIADGREYLLVGDIAWNGANIRLPRMHPRWVNWAAHEDGQAMAQQLRYLHDLSAAEPHLTIVVAHDAEQMDDYVRRGLIQEGFL